MTKTMKPGTKDQAESTIHEMKRKIDEITGKPGDILKLEVEGKDQGKISQVEKVLGKWA